MTFILLFEYYTYFSKVAKQTRPFLIAIVLVVDKGLGVYS